MPLDLALVAPRFLQIQSCELIAHFRREFAIIDGAECRLPLVANLREEVKFVFQFLLVVKLSVEFSALELGSLLPPIQIEAVLKHE